MANGHLQIKRLGRQCGRKGNGGLIRDVSNLKKQKKQKETPYYTLE